MNKHYWIVWVAFLLAQALVTSIMVYRDQKNKKIDWWPAMKFYCTAEFGFFVIGFIGIGCICFILSDFIDLSLTREDLANQEKKTWKVLVQLYFKTTSLFIGGLIQYIAFTYKDRGSKLVDKAADKLLP